VYYSLAGSRVEKMNGKLETSKPAVCLQKGATTPEVAMSFYYIFATVFTTNFTDLL